jgi:hypothetical protein
MAFHDMMTGTIELTAIMVVSGFLVLLGWFGLKLLGERRGRK